MNIDSMKMVFLVCMIGSTVALESVVAPISPGENMWNIISRIEATNTTSVASFQSLLSTCTIITTVPYTISVSGNYCLGTNVSVSGAQAAISINAQDVYLDLSNNEIIGTGGTTQGITISSGLSNITVANGVINGTNVGVAITQTLPTVTVSNVVIQAVTTGIAIASNANGVLLNNVAINNTPTGIDCSGTTYAVFDGCTITNATTTGINFANASVSNILKSCTIETGTNGIVFNPTSIHNFIIGCNFLNQAVVGINLGGSSYNVIDSSIFETIGIVTTQYAINASSTTGILVRNCIFTGNSGGINAASSTNAVVVGCSVVGNGIGNGIIATLAPTLFAVNNMVRNHATNYNSLPGTTPIVTSAARTATSPGFWTNISG